VFVANNAIYRDIDSNYPLFSTLLFSRNDLVALSSKGYCDPTFLWPGFCMKETNTIQFQIAEERVLNMLIVTLHVSVAAHMMSHVVNLFDSYRGPVSVRVGCKSVNLYGHISIPGSFVLVEEWNSRRALEEHVTSDDFRKVLAIMDLAGEAPELRFHTVSVSEGFDLVVKLRKEEGEPGA